MKTTLKPSDKGYKEIGHYLVVDPEICHGKLTFKGTRIPVETVLTFLSTGDSIESILKNWPRLKREAVEEAVKHAAQLVRKRYSMRMEAA